MSIFGKKKPVHMEENDPNNYIWAIKKAKEELMESTGEKEFTLQDIWAQIYKSK